MAEIRGECCLGGDEGMNKELLAEIYESLDEALDNINNASREFHRDKRYASREKALDGIWQELVDIAEDIEDELSD